MLSDVDVDIKVTKGKDSPEGQLLKEMMRKGEGAKVIRQKLRDYVDALKVEYSQGLILPGKNDVKSASTGTKQVLLFQKKSVFYSERFSVFQAVVSNAKTVLNNHTNTDKMKSLDLGGSKLEVSDIELSEGFKCTGMELYNALTQPEMIQVFTQSQVKMEGDAKKGTDFAFLDGNIQGTFTGDKARIFSNSRTKS